MRKATNISGLARVFSFLYLISNAASDLQATVSIYDGSDYTDMRPCARNCFECAVGTYGQHDCLAAALGCDDLPAYNDCYCRADLEPSALSIVSRCVSSACQNSIDLTSAVNVYTTYCATGDQTQATAEFTKPATLADEGLASLAA